MRGRRPRRECEFESGLVLQQNFNPIQFRTGLMCLARGLLVRTVRIGGSGNGPSFPYSHRTVGDVRVMRDRKILESKSALVFLIGPKTFAMNGIERGENPLRPLVITEEHVVMQVLGVGL
jgi:hypothetical protein